jgi:hypothetical protein
MTLCAPVDRRLEYPFDISSGGDQVELICELRAEQGRVLFDFHSLRLIRR